MNEMYEKQLSDLRDRMEKAEAFAERVPVLKDEIIDNMITGEESWIKVSTHYKKIRLGWGVNRGFYSPSKNRFMTNGNRTYEGFLWNIYINTLSLYDSYETYGLEDIKNKTPVVFYDASNSTFYCTDEQVGELLEALNEWYLYACEESKKAEKEIRKQELLKELEELEAKHGN